MKPTSLAFQCCRAGLVLRLAAFCSAPGLAAENSTPEVGIAVRGITPELHIRLAGYASRKRAADKLDGPLRLGIERQLLNRFETLADQVCARPRGFESRVYFGPDCGCALAALWDTSYPVVGA